MSYKYWLMFSVLLLYKFNPNLPSLAFSIHSELLFFLLVYLFLKLVPKMPSLTITDEAAEQFHDQEPLISGTKSPSSRIHDDVTKPTYNPVDRNYFDRHKYSAICNYFNNAKATADQANVQQKMKKLYTRKESTAVHCSLLEIDRSLFTPGKVSQIMKKFQQQCGQQSAGRASKAKVIDYPRRRRDNEIEEVETSVCGSLRREEEASYSWVFAEDYDQPKGVRELDEARLRGPPIESVVDDIVVSGQLLSSFKWAGVGNGIINEVMTCNVIDQRTCDWYSVKKELKSNLDKLKPVAIIDPLTLPVKGVGVGGEVKKAVSPARSATNATAMTKAKKLEIAERYVDISSLSPIPEIVNDSYSSTVSSCSSLERREGEIFFRTGVLTQLEALRDNKLADLIIRLQAYSRGYLSRKRLAKLKLEDMAIRCIQRNVRKFMLVRNWPWWRLLVRITPLLNVHRTEQELKIKTEELETLRSLFEKLDQERNALKQENAKLDSRLGEMTVDLAEENSTVQLTSERLKLEKSERMRLEHKVHNLQNQNKKLQENSEKMETELLCIKTAEVNGFMGEDDGDECLSATDDTSSGGVYKQRYERTMRELEYTKKRLQQQHHDDLEQLIAMRKQLEKKIADAYEEVEEQRQVVAQWKRKVQKLNGEMSDLRLMLEDSNSRNNLLEKKQRKFDSELSMLQDELRQEKQNRERLNREKEIISAEKYNLEQHLSDVKLDLEMKDQKVTNLNRELQEITYGGSTEEEVAKLRKIKHELENKVAEQEEELDDMAGQVQLLEQAKLRLQMNLEQIRKEHKKELAQRDEENEEVRCNTIKKVKVLECQLENEHEERTMLLRERHELEHKLADLEDRERSNRISDQEIINRLRRDLKKTKILLHDAQHMLQPAKLDAPNKAMLRQLRNQLEDAECAKNAAIKARQMAEADLTEMTSSLEECQKARSDAEEKATLYSRERTQLQLQLDENEEELTEVLRKYRNAVQQLSNEQLRLHEQANRIAEMESERCSLREQLAEVASRLENIETHGDPSSSLAFKRLELKTKELESKLDLEQTTKSRMEIQISRLKEAAERLQHDADIARNKESCAVEQGRKLQRALREAREAQVNSESKESIETARKCELEKRLEQTETELTSTKADLKLALQRVDDLQCAIQDELDDNEDEESDSDNDESGSSNDSLQSYLTQTMRRVSVDKWLNNGASPDIMKS